MNTSIKNRVAIYIAIFIVVVIAVGLAVYLLPKPTDKQLTSSKQPVASPQISSAAPKPTQTPEPVTGQVASVADAFSVNVPNGWRASVSSNSSFLAIMFARPGQIHTLTYDKAAAPAVDYDGIPAWNGLTEHYYVRAITTASQAFKPSDHAEVTSESFTFDDGTKGTKYLVTKHAAEAQKWGGLLKDNEWYGRVFVYEKAGKRVEAHLAFYPSTGIDEAFFENVARTITI